MRSGSHVAWAAVLIRIRGNQGFARHGCVCVRGCLHRVWQVHKTANVRMVVGRSRGRRGGGVAAAMEADERFAARLAVEWRVGPRLAMREFQVRPFPSRVLWAGAVVNSRAERLRLGASWGRSVGFWVVEKISGFVQSYHADDRLYGEHSPCQCIIETCVQRGYPKFLPNSFRHFAMLSVGSVASYALLILPLYMLNIFLKWL